MTTIRPVRWPEDVDALAEIDRSFVTDRIYRVVADELAFHLIDELAAAPVHKHYELDFEERAEWDCMLAAEESQRIVGFAAAQFAAWNRRVVIHHLYVAPDARGSGAGTQLIAALDAFAQSVNARCLWLETQNINYSAIQFYRRRGFQLCGCDRSLYAPEHLEQEEIALFFSRPTLQKYTEA